MYVAVRSYSGQGASELFDVLGQREDDVKSLISSVPGFVSYAAFRSGDGGVTVTICEQGPHGRVLPARRQLGQGECQHDGEPARRDHGGEYGPPVLVRVSSRAWCSGSAVLPERTPDCARSSQP